LKWDGLALMFFGNKNSSYMAYGPLNYLGKISYALYVFHWPVLFFSAMIFLKIGFIGPLQSRFFVVLTFTVTVLVSAASFHLFESSFLKLKNRARKNEIINGSLL
jgi:peptidoglycan/LPS O-acetylase OafA/YrhL